MLSPLSVRLCLCRPWLIRVSTKNMWRIGCCTPGTLLTLSIWTTNGQINLALEHDREALMQGNVTRTLLYRPRVVKLGVLVRMRSTGIGKTFSSANRTGQTNPATITWLRMRPYASRGLLATFASPVGITPTCDPVHGTESPTSNGLIGCYHLPYIVLAFTS